MTRVILTTGGTGGHIFPAIAVAQALRQVEPGIELLFVGGLYGPEQDLAAKAGLNFTGLPVRGLQGRGLKALGAGWNMLRAIGKASRLINDFQPNVVAGFGGYAAFATVFAAKTRGVKTLIHEQNAIPGTANRILGKFADCICLSVPDALYNFASNKCIITGNPVRQDIEHGNGSNRGSQTKTAPMLLIMGGSQGARAINDLVISILPDLSASGIRHLHQSGRADHARVKAAYLAQGYTEPQVEASLTPFIDDMPTALAGADLALCRSGATSLAELALAGLPAILVPFPHAIHDHQTENARVYATAGAAILLPEADLPTASPGELIVQLLADQPRLEQMSLAMRKLAAPDAARQVAKRILGVATKQGKGAGCE